MEFKFMTYLNFLLNIRFIKPILATILLLMMAISSLNIYIDSKLPDEEKIRDIELQVPLKIYTSDLKLIGEFGEKRRTALKFENIPQHYINAVLAAEDDSFFEHSGVSYSGLVRSFYRLLISGRIQGGGSTPSTPSSIFWGYLEALRQLSRGETDKERLGRWSKSTSSPIGQ